LLDDMASDCAAVPDWQAALDQWEPTFRNIVPAGILGGTNTFGAARCGDIGKPLACCCAYLLELVQYVCPRLFEKRPPLLSHLDRVGQVNGSRDVWHFT